MTHPWTEVPLSDYEAHMGLADVRQLQQLDSIMREQFSDFPSATVLILGIAGGNGLRHIRPEKVKKVIGVDINPSYLSACRERYRALGEKLQLLCLDLSKETDIFMLPHTDLVIANLLIEYVGIQPFLTLVKQVQPCVVSCVIQKNGGNRFVSESPYASSFAGISKIHMDVKEKELQSALDSVGMIQAGKWEYPLPDGKRLCRLDFESVFTLRK